MDSQKKKNNIKKSQNSRRRNEKNILKKKKGTLDSPAGRRPKVHGDNVDDDDYWKYGSEYMELRIADLVDAAPPPFPVGSRSAEHLLGSSGSAMGGCKYAENRLSSSCSAIGGCR